MYWLIPATISVHVAADGNAHAAAPSTTIANTTVSMGAINDAAVSKVAVNNAAVSRAADP